MHKKDLTRNFVRSFSCLSTKLVFLRELEPCPTFLALESLFASRVLLFQRKVAGFTASPSVGFGLVKH